MLSLLILDDKSFVLTMLCLLMVLGTVATTWFSWLLEGLSLLGTILYYEKSFFVASIVVVGSIWPCWVPAQLVFIVVERGASFYALSILYDIWLCYWFKNYGTAFFWVSFPWSSILVIFYSNYWFNLLVVKSLVSTSTFI